MEKHQFLAGSDNLKIYILILCEFQFLVAFHVQKWYDGFVLLLVKLRFTCEISSAPMQPAFDYVLHKKDPLQVLLQVKEETP